MKRKPKILKPRPLMFFAIGVATLGLVACDEETSYGNPKMPPDLSGEVGGDLGNPKGPPDMTDLD